MHKIVRNYVIITSFLLCLTLLATGIIGVNTETSYVISGKRDDVLKVQSTTSEKLLIKQGKTQENIVSLSTSDTDTFMILLAGILPAPLSNIAWVFC